MKRGDFEPCFGDVVGLYNINKGLVKAVMIEMVTIILQPGAQGMTDQATAFAGSAEVGGGSLCSGGLPYTLRSVACPPFFLTFLFLLK